MPQTIKEQQKNKKKKQSKIPVSSFQNTLSIKKKEKKKVKKLQCSRPKFLDINLKHFD